MKKYELLKLDVQNSALSDIITTSADVTTEEIPWQTTTDAPYNLYLLDLPSSNTYQLD
ncbi:MAG: hypothetical protein IKB38_07435 [Clostridia bacterium]|nr:hypothetical protein [Clostridia bacterium]